MRLFIHATGQVSLMRRVRRETEPPHHFVAAPRDFRAHLGESAFVVFTDVCKCALEQSGELVVCRLAGGVGKVDARVARVAHEKKIP